PVDRPSSNPGCAGCSGCALLSQRARLAQGDCDLARSIRAGASGEARDRRVADLYHHGVYRIGSRLGTARPRFRGRQTGAGLAEDWNGAIAALKRAALRDPRNADIQNYIGYAYRRLRQLGPAMQHYQEAILLNRRHRSAHEHLGELYLVFGDPAKAGQQLAT